VRFRQIPRGGYPRGGRDKAGRAWDVSRWRARVVRRTAHPASRGDAAPMRCKLEPPGATASTGSTIPLGGRTSCVLVRWPAPLSSRATPSGARERCIDCANEPDCPYSAKRTCMDCLPYCPPSAPKERWSRLVPRWVATELNDRPRKRRGFRKPIEQIVDLLWLREDHPAQPLAPDHTSASFLTAASSRSGLDPQPARTVSSVISLGAKTRIGGPQKPVPRLV
jgi:hypothetical protein